MCIEADTPTGKCSALSVAPFCFTLTAACSQEDHEAVLHAIAFLTNGLSLKSSPEIFQRVLQTIWHGVRKDSSSLLQCYLNPQSMWLKLPLLYPVRRSGGKKEKKLEKKKKRESINPSSSCLLNLALSGSTDNSWWQLSKVSKFRQFDSPFSWVSPGGDNNQASHDEFHSTSGTDYRSGSNHRTVLTGDQFSAWGIVENI